ncbi:MAG: uL15 family ribosomal protein [Patescibacteria group bacterium]
MITLSNLEKISIGRTQRKGRGEGSKRGKNSGKGHKGQTKRSGGVPIFFVGRQSDAGSGILSRTPKTKGFKARDAKNQVSLYIERIAATVPANEVIDLKVLNTYGLIGDKIKIVKVIKGQEDTQKLAIKFDENSKITFSKGVKEIIA